MQQLLSLLLLASFFAQNSNASDGFELMPDVILSRSQADAVLRLRSLPNRGIPLRPVEEEYQQTVQAQTFQDLLELYADQNEMELVITYASFTPDDSSTQGGDDAGFGLHVVKRYLLPGGRTLDVNEQWPEDKQSHALLMPDEIRIKTQVFSGPRGTDESYKLYVYDSIHLAWDSGNGEALIVRQNHYGDFNQKTGRNYMTSARIPVGSPFHCMACHDPNGNLGARFLQPGEKANLESIVSDSQFKLPLNQTRGYVQYMAYLKKVGAKPEFIAQVEKALLDPRRGVHEAYMRERISAALKKGVTAQRWVDDDAPPSGQQWDNISDEQKLGRQFVYRNAKGEVLREAVAEIFEGMYRWWEPSPVIPPETKSGSSGGRY